MVGGAGLFRCTLPWSSMSTLLSPQDQEAAFGVWGMWEWLHLLVPFPSGVALDNFLFLLFSFLKKILIYPMCIGIFPACMSV